jgi:hypothetical protein
MKGQAPIIAMPNRPPDLFAVGKPATPKAVTAPTTTRQPKAAAAAAFSTAC